MIERLLAADAALDRGELEHAERMYAQVAEADARNAIALVGLARVAVRRGAEGEARALARRALDIDAQEAAARRLLDDLDAPPVSAVPPNPPQPALAAATPPAPPAATRARSGWRAWLARLFGRR